MSGARATLGSAPLEMEALADTPALELKPDGHRQHIGLLLLCTIAMGLLSLSLPILTSQVYDRVLPNPGTGTLAVLVCGVVLAIVLEAVLRVLRAFLIGRVGASYEHRMGCMAMDRILNADLSRFGGFGIGEYLNRVTAVARLKDLYNGHAFTVGAELAFVPVFLLAIAAIAGPLALVPLAVLSGFVVAALVLGRRLRRALLERNRADDQRFDFLIEALEGVHTLKAFALERPFERRYETLEASSSATNYDVAARTSAMFDAGAAFANVMIAAVISVGALQVLEGQLSAGALVATLLLSGRLMQPLQRALALWARFQHVGIAKAHIAEVLRTPQWATRAAPQSVAPVPTGTLSLSGLSFERSGIPLFRRVDLSLKPGEVVLLTGPNQAGKTALLDLIAGIYGPSGGTITVDDMPVEQYDPGILVRHVGLVRADAPIFRGTIRDNITAFGQIDEAQAREVAALLDVDADVATLPEGFDTALSGTSADNIPPGLLQRIAVARALAPKPRLILFDNADRALDRKGYASVYGLLARLKGRASMILVSDDENVRALADRVFSLTAEGLKPEASVAEAGNVRPFRELRL